MVQVRKRFGSTTVKVPKRVIQIEEYMLIFFSFHYL